MTSFAIVNKLVGDLFTKHAGDNAALFGAACQAFQVERAALLATHGWTVAEFQDRVDDFVSDIDPS